MTRIKFSDPGFSVKDQPIEPMDQPYQPMETIIHKGVECSIFHQPPQMSKTIILNDYEGCGVSDVHNSIFANPSTHYEIQLHKKYLHDKTHYNNYLNYSNAAFIGELLASVSSDFNYWVPAAIRRDPFTFEVEIKNLEKFFEVIKYISAAYINSYDPVLNENFEDDAFAFHEAALYDDEEHICRGLIEVAAEYKLKHKRSMEKKVRKQKVKAWLKNRFSFLKLIHR